MCLWECYLGAVEDHGALWVSGGGGRAGCRHLWRDEHRLLLPPEVVLTEDKVGQVARQTIGLEDLHLRERRRGNVQETETRFLLETFVGLSDLILAWRSGSDLYTQGNMP